MEKLIEFSRSRIYSVNTLFKRYLWDKINWNNRLIAVTGARGVGKTTMLLQYIRENLDERPDEVIYVNLDDLYFSRNTIVDFADQFVKKGGKYLFLDEVHKYRNWSQEIKNCYDYFPDLKIVVTGSSALKIYEGKADLSRRAIHFMMHGLSFREFIDLKYSIKFPVLTLENILNEPSKPIAEILNKIKPIKIFEEYLKTGYYPFFVEGESDFQTRLRQTVNHIMDSDIPSVENIDFTAVYNLRKLLSILSGIVPYKPNILKLSQQVGVSRETLLRYLYLLEKADLLILLQSDAHGIGKMNKPEKIYLNNPNLIDTLAGSGSNPGTRRETFFLNQLRIDHDISASSVSDFLVDKKITFEVGGKNKSRKQIAAMNHAYIAADNVEYAVGNRIPLWLFGFLY